MESFRYRKEENDRKLLSLKKEKEELTGKLKAIDDDTVQKNDFLRNLVKGKAKAELTVEAVRLIIKRIEVYQDRRVRIVFRFRRREIPFQTEGGQTE